MLSTPALTTGVAILTATESSLIVSVALNAVAGFLVAFAIVVFVGSVSRRIAEQRVYIAQAAEQGVWRARVQRLSIHNEETGLYNDWYFRVRFQDEIDRSRRYEQPCGLLLIKSSVVQVDSEGGDGWFGRTVGKHLRKTDVPALMQDGHIAVMLPNANHDDVQLVWNRVVDELGITDQQMGYACFPEDGQDVTSLMRAATEPPSQAEAA